MYMRISSALCGALLLSACGGGGGSNSLEAAEAGARARAAENGLISCAIGTAKQLAQQCSVERDTAGGALTLTIRHPDGGFRRFNVVTGKGVVAADGAETATVTPVGPREIEVRVGTDRYRLPATVKGATTPGK